jgi:hypothetical protein
MERVVVSFLALMAAAMMAISLALVANKGFGIPPAEIRLNALTTAAFMGMMLVLASVRRR